MAHLNDYRQNIMEGNPNQQVIEVSLHPNKWERFFNSYPILQEVFNDLTLQRGRYLITRNDVRNATGKQRIIKALLWAFADNPKVHNLERLLLNLDKIVNLMSAHQDNDLKEDMFKQLYRELLGIPGVGTTTANILFFFYNVKCNGCSPVAITNHITDEFERFDELLGYATQPYYEQVYRFNEISESMGVTAEQVEYFLYRVNNREITIN